MHVPVQPANMLSSLKYVQICTHEFASSPDLAWKRYRTIYNLKKEGARLAAERLENYSRVKHSCWDSPSFEREDMKANQHEAYLVMRAVHACGLFRGLQCQ